MKNFINDYLNIIKYMVSASKYMEENSYKDDSWIKIIDISNNLSNEYKQKYSKSESEFLDSIIVLINTMFEYIQKNIKNKEIYMCEVKKYLQEIYENLIKLLNNKISITLVCKNLKKYISMTTNTGNIYMFNNEKQKVLDKITKII